MGGRADQKISDTRENDLNRAQTLNFFTLNVCGLKSKLLLPEFHTLISQYDIVGLQESKTDSLETLIIPGYKLLCKHRKHISKKKSGGIIVAYKEGLDKHISYIDSDSKQVLWFKISNSLTKCGHILCGVVYIPPENSVYAVESPYSEIEAELRSLINTNNCSSVIMLGDYNSRSRNLEDFTIPDVDIFEHNDLREVYEEMQTDLNYFEQNPSNVSLRRQNPDGGINNYGYRLVEFCCDNSLYIMNGRTKGNSCFQNTCKNVSTVDYFLMSPCLFQYVDMLHVHEYCELFSDVHCAVSMDLNISYELPDSLNRKCSTEKTKLWDDEKRELFVSNLDDTKLGSILNKIETENSQNVSQVDVNCTAESLAEVFNSAARASFGSVKYNCKPYNNRPPHWFNRKCKLARNDFHRAKYFYKLRHTDRNKQRLRTSSKQYKRTLSLEQNLFKLSKIKQLRKIKKSEPRKF